MHQLPIHPVKASEHHPRDFIAGSYRSQVVNLKVTKYMMVDNPVRHCSVGSAARQRTPITVGIMVGAYSAHPI